MGTEALVEFFIVKILAFGGIEIWTVGDWIITKFAAALVAMGAGCRRLKAILRFLETE